jgi:threonine dehydrogenase-like Zn-dependent dehydrogenase
MRATVMFGRGDVRIEDVPDARLVEPTDAVVVVTRAAIWGSDLGAQRRRPARGSLRGTVSSSGSSKEVGA